MDLKQALLMNLVVEEALREKIEDLVDAHDLEEAQRTAVSFRRWDEVEASASVPLGAAYFLERLGPEAGAAFAPRPLLPDRPRRLVEQPFAELPAASKNSARSWPPGPTSGRASRSLGRQEWLG